MLGIPSPANLVSSQNDIPDISDNIVTCVNHSLTHKSHSHNTGYLSLGKNLVTLILWLIFICYGALEFSSFYLLTTINYSGHVPSLTNEFR